MPRPKIRREPGPLPFHPYSQVYAYINCPPEIKKSNFVTIDNFDIFWQFDTWQLSEVYKELPPRTLEKCPNIQMFFFLIAIFQRRTVPARPYFFRKLYWNQYFLTWFKFLGGEDHWSWNPKDRSHEVRLNGPKNRIAHFHPNWSNGTAGVRGTRILNGGRFYWEINVTKRIFGTR